MIARPRTQATVRHALWLGGLLVVLAGLFGMHGLDNHGSAAMSGHGAVGATHGARTTPTTLRGVADSSGHAVMLGGAFVADAVVSGEGPSSSTMAGVCMAVLVVGLLTLLLLLRSSRAHVSRLLRARVAPAPAFRGRDPDPPCLFTLCVQRC